MITVEIDSVDVTDQIEQGTLVVTQNLTNLVDTAQFSVRKAGSKTLTPAYGSDVVIYDGATKIFGGTILSVEQTPVSGPEGAYYKANCVDYTYEMDKILVGKTYTGDTIEDIIDDLITTYAPGFTSANATSTFTIEKIVFNQVPISTCLKRLAEVVNYDWYVDADKDVHFFAKEANAAPFDLTDTNGNYISKTLKRTSDGSQLANRVKVRGGEYDGETFSDSITVAGDDTKSFKLPYRFANLTVTLDTGSGAAAQTVGTDFIDDFTTDDVLYNYQEQTIRFENNLSDGDVIAFSGNPKVPVLAVAEDTASVEEYGRIEKIIRDNSIESNTVARKRATAELYAFAEPVIDASFKTYTAGLRVGMTINLQSDSRGLNDQLIIKTLTFSMRDHESFTYKADLISNKRYDLITLLQKILEPDPQPGDQQETSEELFARSETLVVSDAAEVLTPSTPLVVESTDGENGMWSGTTHNKSFTTPSGTNLLVVTIMQSNGGAPSGITFNGDALTKEIDVTGSASIWYLANPDIGNYTLQFTGVGSEGDKQFAILAISGADTSDVVEGTDSVASGDSSSLTKRGDVTQSARRYSIFVGCGYMRDPSGLGTKDFTPTDSRIVEVYDDATISNYGTTFYRIFTTPGPKTVSTTYSQTADTHRAFAFAMFNGENPET